MIYSSKSFRTEMSDLEFKLQDKIDEGCGIFEKDIYETYIDKNVGVMDLNTEEHYGILEDVSVSFVDGDITVEVKLNVHGCPFWFKIQEIRLLSDKAQVIILLQKEIASMVFNGEEKIKYSDVVYLNKLVSELKPSDIKAEE
jgi:hypothetical protein